jgi:hypothetical protein
MTLTTIHGGANGCAACGHQFGSLAQFDAHQAVDYSQRRAVTCTEPSILGLVRDVNGVWQTPEGLANRERTAERLREARQARPLRGHGEETAA